MNCFKCNKKFNKIFMNITTCYICKKYYCFDCIHTHTHNFFDKKITYVYSHNYVVDDEFEELIHEKRTHFYNMIKENQIDFTYKSLYTPTYELMADSKRFQSERHMMIQNFMYSLVKMILKKRFYNDIVEIILMYL